MNDELNVKDNSKIINNSTNNNNTNNNNTSSDEKLINSNILNRSLYGGLHRRESTLSENSYQQQHQKLLNSSNSQFSLNKNYLDSLEYSSIENSSSFNSIINNSNNNNNISQTKEELQNQLLNSTTPPSSTRIKTTTTTTVSPTSPTSIKDYISQYSEEGAGEERSEFGKKNTRPKVNRTMSNVSSLTADASVVSFDELDIQDSEILMKNLKLTQSRSSSTPSPNNISNGDNQHYNNNHGNVTANDNIKLSKEELSTSSSTSSSLSDQDSMTPPISTTPPQQAPAQQILSTPLQQKNNKILLKNKYWVEKTTPINFNVGGTLFASSLRTVALYPSSLIFKIVEIQIELVLKDEVIFIDRSPLYFGVILDFLRTGQYIVTPGVSPKGILLESDFYKLDHLSSLIKDEAELTRTEVIQILNTCYDYPRLRGMWLCKINFSGLELTCAMFEYSNLTGCLFNSSLLPKSNFQGCKLDCSGFKHCKAEGANFSKAIITNSNFANVIGTEIIAIGANFSNSKLSNSVLSCSDFSSSTFKGAFLDGVDFTNCNLSDCDFRDCQIDSSTNFSGSNLKGALFDQDTFSIAKNKKSWKKPKSLRHRISIPHI